MHAAAAGGALNKQQQQQQQQQQHHHHHEGREVAPWAHVLTHEQNKHWEQALYAFALAATCILSLFALGPRLAFSGAEDPYICSLFGVQIASSCAFLALYAFGAVRWRGDIEIVSTNVASIVAQVVVASLLPLGFDLASAAPELRWVGVLRFLYVANLNGVFVYLETNLMVPHYVPSTLRNITLLCFTTHYAACFFWLLARWKGFTEETWVGAHAPDLIDASANHQYLHALYFSVITASTVGYGDLSPVSKSEITAMIAYVLINVLLIANIVGGISALATRADTDLAEQRARIARFERMLKLENISESVANATREYLRLSLRLARVDVDSLPASVAFRIRHERFGTSVRAAFPGVSNGFVSKCVSLVKDEAFVRGMELIRGGDMVTRCCVVVSGTAGISDVALLHPGATFGAFVVAMHQPWTVVATTFVRILSLNESDRRELEACFPNEWFTLRSSLLDETERLEKAATDDGGSAVGGPVEILKPNEPWFIQAIRGVKETVARDVSRASHDLAALHCHVAANGDDAQLRRLLDMVPVDLVQADYDGRTALHLAAANGHSACVRVLLEAGATPKTDRFGTTPLLEAVINGHDDIIDALRRLGPLGLSDQSLAHRLCAAAAAGDTALVSRYVRAGANPDAGDYDNRTALMLAAAVGAFSVCRVLLDNGANPTLEDRWGHDALHEAQFHNHTGALSDYLAQANKAWLLEDHPSSSPNYKRQQEEEETCELRVTSSSSSSSSR
ncbi:hypothetical protein CTAYLR_006240 [Chrysophaeum taylorii]|uniref:Potassium channel domain-containing protein n=1 Tax=Chrysophaeum taylorii TaxID=2483200 RepID=A0AAD7UJ67_9STRA|nr:hypothetical protein CTAYLR_006240 [Chrysophaeum taylorii]